MSKNSPPVIKPTDPPAKPAVTKAPPSTNRTIRETIESVIIAFVLAFLFRTFEAEAFVIPTGSMAPTLQGRHKDLECPKCGFPYRVSASSEEDDEVQRLRMERNHAALDRQASLQEQIKAQEVVGGTCPNCRYTMDLDQAAAEGLSTKTYNGDRILVAKFPYDFSEPRRWDVVVFRYPGDAKMNYIKRLIGLPHETIKIYHGDIYVKPPDGTYEIARKPAEKVLAMAQTVYDNDYPAPELAKAGWPARWQPVGAAGAREWDSSDEGREFAFNGGKEAWLRYQHFAPFEADWQQIERNGRASAPPLPHLITDFYAYNTHELRGRSTEGSGLGQHWVSDLILEATLDVQGDQGTVVFDLVKGGLHFNCTFDVANGQAQLGIDGDKDFHPTAQTAIRGVGKHRVTFANVDRQLRVWVDGSEVSFSPDGTYPDLNNSLPTRDDLSPAGIAVQGVKATVSHLVLKRDLYYIAERGDATGRPLSDYDHLDGSWDRKRLADFFAEPDAWTTDSLFGQRRSVEFPLKADQFFVLGDNSPASKDSRLWSEGGPEYYVSRELLIGKALYIYWPHSLDKIPYLNIPFPFFPNLKDMGFVR